jgi:hypothetical protein
LVYDTWIPAFAWDGHQLLVLHGNGSDYEVDVLRYPPTLGEIERVPAELSTRIFLDGGNAVLVDRGQDTSSREVRSQQNGFRPTELQISTSAVIQAVRDNELHVVVSEGDAWRYEVGPLQGPLDLVAQGEGDPYLTIGDPIVPIAVESSDDGTDELTLTVELEGEARSLSGVTAPWTLYADADSLFAWGRTQSGRLNLWWDGGERFEGTDEAPIDCGRQMTVNAPAVCPTESTGGGFRAGVVLAANAAVDEDGVHWVAYLLADMDDTCNWAVTSGCFESLPCGCAETLSSRPRTTTLVIEGAIDPARSIRIDLPPLRDTTPGLRVLADGGKLSVALSDADSFKSYLHFISLARPQQ